MAQSDGGRGEEEEDGGPGQMCLLLRCFNKESSECEMAPELLLRCACKNNPTSWRAGTEMFVLH